MTLREKISKILQPFAPRVVESPIRTTFEANVEDLVYGIGGATVWSGEYLVLFENGVRGFKTAAGTAYRIGFWEEVLQLQMARDKEKKVKVSGELYQKQNFMYIDNIVDTE